MPDEQLEDLRIGMPGLRDVGDHADEIDVLERALDGLAHERPELPRRRVQPRCVDEHDLGFRQVANPRDAIARGLRAGRHDCQLLAHQTVEQRRFAGIRAAHEGNEAGAGTRGVMHGEALSTATAATSGGSSRGSPVRGGA